jgi:nucleoside-diphosphate-sugar epimerase
MARILVAGGSGFIGTHMIRFLRNKGHYVISTDIELPRWTSQEADVFIQADLRLQHYAASVTKKIDWVFNFAADMGGMGFIGDPSLQAEILYNNTLISFNLLEAARKAGVQRYFQASSVCVYPMYLLDSIHPAPLCEEDCYPASPQGTYRTAIQLLPREPMDGKNFRLNISVRNIPPTGWRHAWPASTMYMVPWAPGVEVGKRHPPL